LTNPEVVESLQTYYESHVSHHKLDNGATVAVTPEGRYEEEPQVDENGEAVPDSGKLTYTDEARNVIFSLDPASGKAEIVREGTESDNPDIESLK